MFETQVYWDPQMTRHQISPQIVRSTLWKIEEICDDMELPHTKGHTSNPWNKCPKRVLWQRVGKFLLKSIIALSSWHLNSSTFAAHDSFCAGLLWSDSVNIMLSLGCSLVTWDPFHRLIAHWNGNYPIRTLSWNSFKFQSSKRVYFEKKLSLRDRVAHLWLLSSW